MMEPIFRTTGKFIELEYPGVTRKLILKKNISFIQCSQYSICISVSGVEGSVETVRFTTTDKLDTFLRAILVELSKDESTYIAKVNKELATFVTLVNKKIEKMEGEVKAVKDTFAEVKETSAELKGMCTQLEGNIKELEKPSDGKIDDSGVFIDLLMFLAVVVMSILAALAMYHCVRLFRTLS
jgi:methyl-accepting chemotaxis protein